MNINYAIEDAVEQNHWWFKGRRKIIKNILDRSLVNGENKTALDLGCGTGANIGLFEKYTEVIGLDSSEEALSYCRKKTKSPLVCGEALQPPFKTNTFSMVFAMDIFEHIDDDARALKGISKIMKKGGKLLMTCPAFRFLWGGQDEVSGHKRRYTVKQVCALLAGEDFIIQRITYFNMFLFLPILMTRKLLRFLGKRYVHENKVNNILMNTLFTWLLNVESLILQYVNLPFGTSILCLAIKGGDDR